MHKSATKTHNTTQRLTFIRHTKVADPSVCYGQMDVPLDSLDFEQTVKALQKVYPNLTCIYSSPAKRCLVLAKALCRHVIVIDELLEMDFGDWQIKSWNDIDRSQIDDWANDVLNYQIPNGESCLTFYQRTKLGFDKLPNQAVVITHGGTIRSAYNQLGGLNFEQSTHLKIEHGHVYHINSKSSTHSDQ
ncbi:histidine phosphatase family protein [Marinicellulosiphila megalodicopiae]|uniref:histidine phosphatase family protein n=1 Tax=Marinicellulosiphila megalodicopiae TaxID=2724896 RepID=UPI003BB09E15